MATSRRARAVAQARQAAEDAAFLRRAKGFVRLLRNQAGIPVRQPAHQAAPFRAIPINWFAAGEIENTLAGGAPAAVVSRSIPINWSPAVVFPTTGTIATQDLTFAGSNGIDCFTGGNLYSDDTGEQFPDGYIGFITKVSCHSVRSAFSTFDAVSVRNARWSWRVDSAYIPGFRNALPTQELQAVAPSGMTIGETLYPQAGQTATDLGCAVQIRSGQRSFMEFSLFNPGDVAGVTVKRYFVFRLSGYAIPTKTDDATILGTLGD